MRLYTCQGIAGRAYRNGKAASIYFESSQSPQSFHERWLSKGAFRMTKSQRERTKQITGIVSIPLLRLRKDKPPKAVGVINLDAFTREGAKRLKDNEQALIDYFVQVGLLLASLDF
jgi:hypothetical protein